MKHSQSICAAVALAAMLAACGGGGGTDSNPQAADPLASVPENATQSAAGLVGYLDTLSKLLSEVREAVDMASVASLFTSDTTEPETVQ